MRRRRRLRLSKHAIRRMMQRGVTIADVLAVLAKPWREVPGNRRETLETRGRTGDGRALAVETGDERSFVVTVAVTQEL